MSSVSGRQYESGCFSKLNTLETLERRPALVSIHDVMPHTLPLVQQCIDVCRQQGIQAIYLLVVPGVEWSDQQLRKLRRWSADGMILTGHGWFHQASRISSVYHHVHAATISRNVAEHLSLDEDQIIVLMKMCYRWFRLNDLPSPALYVPPAWALGSVSMAKVATTNFEYVETLRGVYHLPSRQWLAGPLVGYEADTLYRAAALTLWNGFNRRMAGVAGIGRIAIHPSDLNFRLRHHLRSDLGRSRGMVLEDLLGGST